MVRKASISRSRPEEAIKPKTQSLTPREHQIQLLEPRSKRNLAQEFEHSTSTEHPAKRERNSTYRIEGWILNGSWPTSKEDPLMDRFRDLAQSAPPRKKSTSSLRRKRSNVSVYSETGQSRTDSESQPGERKTAPYRHPRYEGQMQERGSFMDDHDEGITQRSEMLLMRLLQTLRPPPMNTLFSDDELFRRTCKDLRGENETKVILRIAELIFPSAEILANRGAKHLEILRETTNAGWNNAVPFYGPRPQPDFALGFKREAFTREQLQKLQPFIGNELKDSSYIAATYNMYLPFITSEVKCGASALDIADRQNLHSQTIILRSLIELFRLVGRLQDLHREISSFSISHSDEYVRIYGHYIFVRGESATFHRHSIAKFDISPTMEGDQRWKAWNFFMNVYDYWVSDHFKRVCGAIDMLPADLNFEVPDLSEYQRLDPEVSSSRSGLSQQFGVHSLAYDQHVTADTTTVGSSNSKKIT